MNKPKEEKMTLAKLAKQMNARFDNLEKRTDKIDTRLDYVIKANNLKDILSEKR